VTIGIYLCVDLCVNLCVISDVPKNTFVFSVILLFFCVAVMVLSNLVGLNWQEGIIYGDRHRAGIALLGAALYLLRGC
jgi:hypothetical protein